MSVNNKQLIALIIAGLMIYLANGKGKVAQAILKVIGGLLFLAIIGVLVVVAIAIVSALGVIKTLIVLAFLGLVFLLMLTHSLYELTREVYRSVSRLEKELSESKTEINFAIRNLERRNYSALNHSSQTDKTSYLFHDWCFLF